MLPRSPRHRTLIREPSEISVEFLIPIATLPGLQNNYGNSSGRVGTTC